MEYEVIAQYLKPEMVVLAVALYFIGIALKRTSLVADCWIPMINGVFGILLAAFYICSVTPTPKTYQEVIGMILEIIVQGIICAAASTYVNQIKKQITNYKNGDL